MTDNKIMTLLKDIRKAIVGTQYDFTSGSIKRAILLLSVPMVLEMVMESIFAVVDIFFVSKKGADAVAIVGITESLITIIYAIAIGLSTATTAMVSRRIGEKNNKQASHIAVQSIIIGLSISFVISIFGVIFSSDLLSLMGASKKVINEGGSYTAIMLGGNSTIMLLFIINAIFRSSGDAAISMRVLWFANLINIVLDPCLILGLGPFPELGVTGAAIATNIGRGAAVIYQFYLLFKGSKRIEVLVKNIKIDLGLIKQILKLSLGGIGQSIIATSSWIGMVRIISIFGSEVLAGYTIAIRIIIFAILPSWGMSNAAATLVGQNLGAKKPDRAERSVWMTGIINIAFMGTIAIFLITSSQFFIELFIDDIEVIKSGVLCLQIISYGFLFYAFGMVIVNAFNGAGDTFTPTIINLFCFWLLEIPLAYFLAIPFGLNEKGVYIAIIVAESAMTITGFLIFRRGKWKTYKV